MVEKKSFEILRNRKIKIALIVVLAFVLLIPLSVLAYRVSIGDYDLWTKFDFGATNTNASSGNFLQRFIFGSQPVTQYSSASFLGRLGILEATKYVAINITYPLNNSVVVRGSDSVTWEDDLGLIDDYVNLTSKVYDTDDYYNYEGAMCYFYWNESLLGNSSSNSSGECVLSYDKTSDNVGIYNFTTNYSFTDDDVAEINISSINVDLVSYSAMNVLGNYTVRGGNNYFQHNDIAKFYVNVTKSNSSGTSFYSPQNITINATDSTGKSYIDAFYVAGYRLKETGTGQYESWVYVNKSFGTNYLRWKILVSDDNYDTYLATALHIDVGVFECGDRNVDPGEDCDNGKQCDDLISDCLSDADCIGIGDGSCEIRAGDGCGITCLNEGCGNNYVDLGEVCDGTDLNGETCVSQGFASGTLACQAGCLAFDTSSCVSGGGTTPGGGGGTSCTDECTSGSVEKVCSSDTLLRIRTCGNYDSDSCLEWSDEVYVDCSSLPSLGAGEIGVCSNAVCTTIQASCTNECEEGQEEKNCLNDRTSRIRTCGNYDVDPCSEWSSWQEETCNQNEECFDGICLSEDKIIELLGCRYKWECSEWSDCQVDYTTQEVFEGLVLDTGYRERICRDIEGCRKAKIEREECELAIPVYSRTADWCADTYVELYERDTDKLVSRIKKEQVEEFKDLARLHISFIVAEFGGYCDYCYDGIKNYDETGIDCGGPSCPACVPKITFFDWLKWLIIFLWILLLLLLLLLLCKRDEDEKKKKRSCLEKLKAMFSFKKYREKNLEARIGKWFKGLFALPSLKIVGRKKKQEKPKKVVAPISREKPKRGLRRIIVEFGEARKERKTRKARKKAEKRKKREIKKTRKSQARAKRKIEKQKKRQARKDRYGKFMRRIREWRRRGYYGTHKLESEVRKHKRGK